MQNVVSLADHRHHQNVKDALLQLESLELEAFMFIAIPKNSDGQYVGTIANDDVSPDKLVKLLDIQKSVILSDNAANGTSA